MGLSNFIKNQFIEVIEWTDQSSNVMVYKFPVANNEIKMGAKLTVRESQVAIFINEGTIADVFSPGLYELKTENMPIMTTLKSWKYGFNSPFKADVYFVNTKQFTDQKWGTINPIMMRDTEFGMIRLRAFGVYSFRVSDVKTFLKEIFGTNQGFETDSITGQLKSSLVSGITDILGESKIPAIDLAQYYDELSKKAKEKLQPRFEELGLSLASIFIENISLPEEVEKALDKKTSMGLLGNMQQYAQYQTAEAIRDSAQNQGNGFAGMGAGMGAGAAIGSMMSNAINTSAAPINQANTIICTKCNTAVAAGQKFCSSCGNPMGVKKVKCVKCNAEIEPATKFCPECGAPQVSELLCSKCGVKLESGVKFCPECGNKI